MFEVIRPNRQHRRHHGKSHPAGADASAVLSGDARGLPKAGNGAIEMIRSLRIVRSSVIKARTQALNLLQALVFTAPDEVRASLRRLSTIKLVRAAPGSDPVLSHVRHVILAWQERSAVVGPAERAARRL